MMREENTKVKPKKFLGQHFLTDLSIARDIADTVDACPDIPVLEEFAPAIRQYGIPYELMNELILGVEMDLDKAEYAAVMAEAEVLE